MMVYAVVDKRRATNGEHGGERIVKSERERQRDVLVKG